MAEHSAWYSGDPNVLSDFYSLIAAGNNLTNVDRPLNQDGNFWGRQLSNQGEVYVHVPVAGDIAETSANFLFAESPLVRIGREGEEKPSETIKNSQKELDQMLDVIGFNNKILEAAESASPMGGIYLKIAIDQDLSPYPIIVVEQPDTAIPEFKFGILTAVTFWSIIEQDESGSKVYRLLERYDKGSISYTLWVGTSDRLGKEVALDAHPDTAGMNPNITLEVDELLAVYVPNMLPNRLCRSSSLGRSDISGLEGLMDSLDEVYSSWVKEISLAQARLLLPEQFLSKGENGFRFNLDKMLYVTLDVDPVSVTQKDLIHPQQFDIRADELEKTALNLLERIVTSAGYSPQSFGLNIQGRAESGTALSMRERKSFATRNKKENYWQPALQKLVRLLILVYKSELKGKIETDVDVNISFSDGITNDLSEISTSVQMLSNAQAASTETRVRLVHPDWNEEQIEQEVNKILDENRVTIPEFNRDYIEMGMSGEEDE